MSNNTGKGRGGGRGRETRYIGTKLVFTLYKKAKWKAKVPPEPAETPPSMMMMMIFT
jgi:hypothetical protein